MPNQNPAPPPGPPASPELLAAAGSLGPGGAAGRLLAATALAWSLFQLWIASPLPFWFGVFIFGDTEARAVHLAFALFLAYAMYRAAGGAGRAPVAAVALALGAVASGAGAAQAGGERAVIFLAMAAILALAAARAIRPSPPDRVPQGDWVLAVAGAAASAYLLVFHRALALRPGRPTLADLLVAGCGMVLLLEATRRVLGPPLAIIALLFLGYTFAGPYMPDLIAHRGASFARAMGQQWLSGEGVFGIALGVSTSFVFLFVLFGSLLEKAGAGNYFIQVAFALLGHLRGGPAKAAVVASGMTGLISGSSIANVVTTGTFTIPLMRRVGFSAEQAGAIEVSASTNGQIMPPVMGAAAFLMVEYVGIPYVDVIKHAFLPAVISYIALFYVVHLEAMKADMPRLPRPAPSGRVPAVVAFGATAAGLVIVAGLVYWGLGWLKDALGALASRVIGGLVLAVYVGLLWYAARSPELVMDDPTVPVIALPPVGPTVKTGLHFLLPVVVLVWALIVERLSPGLSAFWAVAFLMFILVTQRPLLALFRGEGQLARAAWRGLHELREGLVAGARNMVGIGVATAAAGIIVGTVAMTGIGLVMTEVVERLSGGNVLLMLLLTAVISLLLGLGLPTTANYIIVATLMAPVVVELGTQSGLLVPLIAVHLFVFYFGLMADVTPPVGLASFAAAAISRGDPLRTGLQAMTYELRTVALPFMFIFNPQLLLIGIESWMQLGLIVGGAVGAMLVFAAATQGYFLARSYRYESAALLLVAFTLFRPGFWMDQVAPPFERVAPDRILSLAETAPRNGYLRLEVEGEDRAGREVRKLVMLNLGEPRRGAERLAAAGLRVAASGARVAIADIGFGSQAERFGLAPGWTITALKVPAERPAKEWMFAPALALLGIVAARQWIRRARSSLASS